MGQELSGQGAGQGGQRPNQQQDDADKKKKEEKKWEPPVATTLGKKKKKRGAETANRMPKIFPVKQCRLRMLRLERAKDFLTIEEEFLTKMVSDSTSGDSHMEEEMKKLEELRGMPMDVGSLEEIIDDSHCIVDTGGGDMYVPILSFVNKEELELGSSVLLHGRRHSIVGVLQNDTNPLVSVMKVEKAPNETFADIGGLDDQIQELRECVELPLTHPELYEDMGIKAPRGCLLYGVPGSGKTLLAKAVANSTSATFLRIVGSELIQKYAGEGPKLVRELYRTAEEHAPSIVFIDEIDAIGEKRYDTDSSGRKEIQRTMLELLTQLDGFDSVSDVITIAASNRPLSLDPALLRPGRLDRKVEFGWPDEATKRHIFQIHTSRMQLAEDVKLHEFIQNKDEMSGADIKAICTEAGLMALRDRRMKVCHADFEKARENVQYRKDKGVWTRLYL